MQPAGARLGPYEILGPIGAGGMGEVYRAKDSRLGREVALKVLPAGASASADKLRRFELEARAAGALNHPNILGILDVGTHDGHPYVVSELLEGETLRDRLRVSPPPLKKAIELAIQIAHGLAAAHDKGIIHRDLKPENLFVTRDGRAKILDFGLAKLQPACDEEGRTTSRHDESPITEAGTVLGTVGYMSPEQVRGLPTDARSDIFSFGAVLYEMLAGRRAFKRETAAETMTAILKEDAPDLADTARGVPPALERVVRRCLEKSPDERFHSARDVAYSIEVLSGTTPGQASVDDDVLTQALARPPFFRLTRRAIGLAALLLGVAGWLALSAAPPQNRVDLAAYRFTSIATEAAFEGSPAWSPDGSTLAFVRDVGGVLQVFTRSLAAPMAAQITQSPRDCRQPFWSPDGTRVFYISQAGAQESLWAVGAAGGTPQVVLKNVMKAALSPDGQTLAFLREDASRGSFFHSLWTSSPPGAEPMRYQQAPLVSSRFSEGVLRFSPDGKRLAFWSNTVWEEQARGDRSASELWMLPLPTGQPYRVASLSGRPPYPMSWMPDSRNVVFATDQIARSPGMHLWMADTAGDALVPLTATNGSETDPAVSPDGTRIAFTSLEEDYRLIEIPLDGSPYRNAHVSSRMETEPAWSPMGGQYAFVTDRAGSPEIWLRSADGAFERPLVTAENFKGARTSMIASLAVSPDGQKLAYQRATPGPRFGIWVSTIAGGPTVEVASIKDSSYQDFPAWSPDGAWIAFTFMEKGDWSLAKKRVGASEDAVVIKPGIVYPSSPRWSPRGDWITCETEAGFALVSPHGKTTRVLSDETFLVHGWSKDGATIYAIRQTEDLHLQLTSFDVASGREKVVTADLGPIPPTSAPLRGFSLAPDGKSFIASIVQLRGDVWLLEGFQRSESWFDRFRSAGR